MANETEGQATGGNTSDPQNRPQDTPSNDTVSSASTEPSNKAVPAEDAPADNTVPVDNLPSNNTESSNGTAPNSSSNQVNYGSFPPPPGTFPAPGGPNYQANPGQAQPNLGWNQGQVPNQAPYNPGGTYGYGPNSYTGAPVQFPQTQANKPKKIWPWILLTAILCFILGSAFGCVSCSLVSNLSYQYVQNDDSYSESNSSDDEDLYGYDSLLDEYDESSSGSYTYTLDEIAALLSCERGSASDNSGTNGLYTVGEDGDLEPGLYYLEGVQDAESNYYLFEQEGAESYGYSLSVVYYGNYFVELEEGDVFVFMAANDNLRFCPASEADFSPSAPYQSGLYRVGTDIPAGTYTITANSDVSSSSSQESAAYVMTDLDFDDDSFTDVKYVAIGGRQTITVEEGDWLELFAAEANPA